MNNIYVKFTNPEYLKENAERIGITCEDSVIEVVSLTYKRAVEAYERGYADAVKDMDNKKAPEPTKAQGATNNIFSIAE